MSDAYSVGTTLDAAATAGGNGTVIALLKLLTTQLAAGGVANQIEGQVADGAALTGINPVLIGGQDGALVQSMLTDTSGRQNVSGPLAIGAAVSGANPFVAAAENFSNVAVTLRAFPTSDGSSNTLNRLHVASHGEVLNGSSAWDRMRSAAAAANTTGTGLLGTGPLLFDGTNYQIQRGNVESLVVTRTAQTASYTGSDRTNHNGSAIYGFLNVTVNPGGAETLTFALQLKDEAGGDGYVTVASSGAIAVFGTGAGATGLEVILCGPGAAETAAITGFTTQSLWLPRTYRWIVTHSASGAWTYTIADNISSR